MNADTPIEYLYLNMIDRRFEPTEKALYDAVREHHPGQMLARAIQFGDAMLIAVGRDGFTEAKAGVLAHRLRRAIPPIAEKE